MIFNSLTPSEKITRAKTTMSLEHPFFAYILLNFKIKEVKEIPTMGVDANGNLYYNSEFVNELGERELTGVLCHEVLHVALNHLERGEGKDHYLFNIANDLVVNDMLVSSNISLPPKGLIPTHHTFKNSEVGINIKRIDEKSSEEIYEELYKIQDKLPKQTIKISFEGLEGIQSADKNGLGGFDIHIYGDKKGESSDNEGNSETQRVTLDRQQKWRKIIAEAVAVARNQGSLPAGLERRIGDVLDPKINWRTKLYKYVVEHIPFDYSWDRPSRRSGSVGTYLPRTKKESVQIVVSIDTSGSIQKEELEEFYGELKGICDFFPNVNMDLVVCDADIHETYKLRNTNFDELTNLKMSGGGGTSHKPVFDYVNENISDVRVLINFTDGYSDIESIDRPFNYDVMWVICKKGVSEKDISWGEVIKIE